MREINVFSKNTSTIQEINLPPQSACILVQILSIFPNNSINIWDIIAQKLAKIKFVSANSIMYVVSVNNSVLQRHL